jgi:hypothetical protein
MTDFYHNSDAVIGNMDTLAEKFIRARSERSINKLYHEMENAYGYVILSGDKELSVVLRKIIDEAKKVKNHK